MIQKKKTNNLDNFFQRKKNKSKFNKTKNINKSNQLNKKFKTYREYAEFRKLEARKEKTPKLTNYLHINKKSKQGVFLKQPCFNEIKYPFHLNLKLINEFVKKK